MHTKPSATRTKRSCASRHIEELDAKIESCRKFILASRIAMAAGGIVLAAMLVGAIRFDPGTMAAAVAAFLGGIVVWGSNRSTLLLPEERCVVPRGLGASPFGRVYKSSFHPDYSDSCLRQWANSQTNYPDKTPQPPLANGRTAAQVLIATCLGLSSYTYCHEPGTSIVCRS